MAVVVGIVAAMVGAAATLVATLFIMARALRRRRAAELTAELSGETMLGLTDAASFFGVLSRGRGQLRGNGVLALTDHALHFRLLLPDRRLDIPLASIVGVEEASSHLGKTIFRPLLLARYIDADGRTDAAAWHVPHLERWLASLAAAAERARAGGPE